MDTLDLVGADDGVLEGSTVLQDEDGVRVATLLLTSAGNTTAVGLVATIVLAIDLLGGVESDRSLRVGDGEVRTADKVLAESLGLNGRDDARGGEERKKSLGQHCDCGWWRVK